MKKKKKLYLAGYTKELEYRRIVKEKYSEHFHLIDPMDFEVERLSKTLSVEDASSLIINRDKDMILTSDILIAYISKPTFGTIMEIMFAFMNEIPVYVINENKEWINDFWLYYHATEIFISIDSCFEHLISNSI